MFGDFLVRDGECGTIGAIGGLLCATSRVVADGATCSVGCGNDVDRGERTDTNKRVRCGRRGRAEADRRLEDFVHHLMFRRCGSGGAPGLIGLNSLTRGVTNDGCVVVGVANNVTGILANSDGVFVRQTTNRCVGLGS